MLTMRSGVFAATVLSVVSAATADTIYSAQIGDHPDGNQNPPPYGVRLDNLFVLNSKTTQQGSGANVTTFSMSAGAPVILTVDLTGSTLSINIKGEVIGGEKSGGFGHGSYLLDFTYSAGVQAYNGGWVLDPNLSPAGSGFLQANGAHEPNIALNEKFHFKAHGIQTGDDVGHYNGGAIAGALFAFLPDGWRLGGGSERVGRGWLAATNSTGTILSGNRGTQDFLFTVIPLPGTAGLAMAGLGLIAVRRRR